MRADIVTQLKLATPAIFVRGFNRKNISYEVRFKDLLPWEEDLKVRHCLPLCLHVRVCAVMYVRVRAKSF